jgi:hypothetical protein
MATLAATDPPAATKIAAPQQRQQQTPLPTSKARVPWFQRCNGTSRVKSLHPAAWHRSSC